MTGRLLPFCLSAALLLSATGNAFAAAPRGEVMVSGEVVMLGDIFEGAGEASSQSVMTAPAAGRSITLDTRQLVYLARTHQLDWQPGSDVVFTRITRASQRFDALAITEAVTAQMPQTGSALKTVVTLDNPQLVLNAPMDGIASLTISSFSLDATNQRFTGMAQIESNGQIITQSPISGRLTAQADVPVLTHPIRRGEIIGAGDIAWQTTDMTAANSSVIYNAEDIIGKSPRTALRPGVPLRPADLLTPPAITRGSQVTMLYQAGRMHITVIGKALGDAAVGETVRVVNTVSNRTVEGIAQADGTVRFGPITAKIN